MININPGELNKKIKIVKIITDDRDLDGYPIEKEETVRECYAKYSQQSGSEVQKNNSEFTEVKNRFLIRYSKIKVTEDMKILYDDKYFEIVYINSYGDSNEYVEIWCERSEMV